MTKMKKFGALLLALVLVLSLSAPAFADDTTLTNGVAGTNAGTALSKSVQIEKELVVYNQDEVTVAAPQITYTYTLTQGSADMLITDSDNVKALTKAGPLPSVTTATVVYNNEDINAAAAGESNKKTFSFDFSSVNFEAAGVYRYVITETTDVEKAAAGITEGSISNVRYLDVYVRDAKDNESGRQIYGYVLFSENNPINGMADATENTVTNAVKTTGFVASNGPDGTTQLTADQYYTFNVTVSKTLVGDAAKNNNQFPFTVVLTAGGITQNVLLKKAVTGTATQADLTAGTLSQTLEPTIAHNGSVKYIGIPCGTTVQVSETNNVVGTTYASVYSVDNAASAGEKNIYTNEVSETAALNTTGDAADTVAHTVAFTNTLVLISPTGVVLRIAPYALMLSAGIVLFVLSRKRKAAEEEA